MSTTGSTLTRTQQAPVGAQQIHVAMVAPPYFSVPPEAYGGIETVVADLVDALVARGHKVTLIGAGRVVLSVHFLTDVLGGAALGLGRLDAFLVDQPEVHVRAIGKERLNRKLARAFAVLEHAVAPAPDLTPPERHPRRAPWPARQGTTCRAARRLPPVLERTAGGADPA